MAPLGSAVPHWLISGAFALPPQTETGGNHPLAQGQILISLLALGVGMRQSPPLVQRGACICPWTSTG